MAGAYFDSRNTQVALGAEIARGGEGSIFEVLFRPGTVAKIYHKEIPAEKIQKLQRMVQMNPSVLIRLAAWPLDLLYRSSRSVGLLMPRVASEYKDIHKLYSPKS